MTGVLVTGAAGFLGSAVCRAGLAEGASVLGLVRTGELAQPIEGVTYREIDWADDAAVATVLSEAAPERIVHCAGATPRAEMSVAALYDANVGLVWRLLDIVRAVVPGTGVVIVSSAAVYGPSPTVPTAEDEPLNPVTHYAWSKVLAEQTARAFAGTDGLRVCIARPFNLIGAGEPKGSVVSDIIEQIEAGAEVIRVRETVSVRDFVDVDDAARALLLLAGRGEPGEAYNVCSGVGTSVGELVEIAVDVAASGAVVEATDPTVAGTTSTGVCRRLRRLGWEPRAALRASLARTSGRA
ncbi:MAG: NAD-dependent epimerase/dehydratase family protein [Coriobacteriia bacterium]|nr:NAD-dependent epimerase/dehydratase family protein [Coriobacteriia bacterium]